MLHPDTPVLKGRFYDSDDYTVLTQTLNWLQGQNWYDTVQHRLSPPDGVPLHFSRLTQLPLAGLIVIGHALGLDYIDAATVAATLWPLVLFALLLAVIPWASSVYLPRRWARAAMIPLPFLTALTFMYAPGRADHHGLALLLTFAAFGGVARVIETPSRIGSAIAAGVLLATGNAVALETLPYLIILSAFLGLALLVRGRDMAASGAAFGAALFGTGAALLMLLKDPSLWLDPDLLAYSVVYVHLHAAIALCCAALACIALTRLTWGRILFGLILFAGISFVYFGEYPELLRGPYAGADQKSASIFLSNIIEAMPYLGRLDNPSLLIQRLLILVLAIAAAARATLSEEKNGDPMKWYLLLVLLAAPALFSVFYQIRFVTYASLFALIPLAYFLKNTLAWADARWRGHKLSAIQLGCILMIGPLPCFLLPGALSNWGLQSDILLFAASSVGKNACADMAFFQNLNLPPYDKPKRIMNTMDQGAEILFRTKHEVFGAPYHTNLEGIMDTARFFSSRDEDESLGVLRERGIDLVALCDKPIKFYYSDPRETMEATPQLDAASPTMAKRLIEGKSIPRWLKKIDLPLQGPLLLFEVIKDLPKDKAEEQPSAETAQPEQPPAGEQKPEEATPAGAAKDQDQTKAEEEPARPEAESFGQVTDLSTLEPKAGDAPQAEGVVPAEKTVKHNSMPSTDGGNGIVIQ